MTKSPYEVYGAMAASDLSPTEQAGRYANQREAERRILPDLLDKLAIEPTHRLLEIGCGPGQLLIPMSYFVAGAVGLDHPAVVARGRATCSTDKIQWLAGAFPAVRPNGPFDRIVVYSVIQNLRSHDAITGFLYAAIDLLGPGGRLLVGDIPNSDRKVRFRSSEAGRQFEIAWQAEMARQKPAGPVGPDPWLGVDTLGSLDDASIHALSLRCRARGFHAYILPQPPDLPFGNTREDLLIVRP